jgi:succinate dehydrogenase / fumarate reductase, cytochrome b subunit
MSSTTGHMSAEGGINVRTKCRNALTSVTRKQLVALTGLGLAGFVLIHMAGNLLIFVGPEALNEYSHKLTSNPLIFAAEAGLVLMFLGHVLYATLLTTKNWKARPVKYAMLPTGEKRTPWSKRTLFPQGLIVLVFVILHLITFKYGTYYSATYNGVQMRDLYKLVIEVFHEPGYVVWYVIALLILGIHLSHGMGSVFQTLGFNHPRYACAIKWFGRFYAFIVTAGFLSQPIYVFFYT